MVPSTLPMLPAPGPHFLSRLESSLVPESCLMPDVAVIGFGYIGSVIAAVLASRGLEVVGIDTNAALIEAVNAGRCPIPEPGLAELVAEGVAAGRLTATTDPSAGPGAPGRC